MSETRCDQGVILNLGSVERDVGDLFRWLFGSQLFR